MGTRGIVKVIVDDRKVQYYHHFDSYITGTGWDILRTYFSLNHVWASPKGAYSYWSMERTKLCDLTKDIGDNYECEKWETYHNDLEFEYSLDFNNKDFHAIEIERHKHYSLDDIIMEIAVEKRKEISQRLKDDNDTFLSWAKKHGL